jgi:LPS-assembly protein
MMLLFRIILLIWIAAMPVTEGFAADKSKPNATPKGDQEVRISADHMVQEGKEDSVRAWGNVVIRFEDRILRANTVKINNKSGVGEAKGNVVLTSTDGTVIKSERSLFNMNSQRGKAYGVIGKLKSVDDTGIPVTYYFKGKEIKRLSPVHYKLKDSYLTTCQGIIPDWSFQSKNMDLIKEDRALFTQGVFKVRNVPILYLPIGYLPINRERKSGFLIPKFGSSNTDGFVFNPIYYWAINDYSDATIGVRYLQKRGIQPSLEYRYTPSKNTEGKFNGTLLDDDTTGGRFYKIDWNHDQVLPKNSRFRARLDLESDNSFNKTFENNTSLRTRRSTDSFASYNKNWSNSTLNILTRFRESKQDNNDDTFGQLPEITYQNQRQPIGKSSFFFNQETGFTSFLLDLNSSPIVDDDFKVHRFDFHPQISRPLPIAPWLTFTPTLGLRETVYSQGLQPNGLNNQRTGSFTRELFDVNATVLGPKFNKIFMAGRKNQTKIKHLIEPRISYDFIPKLDEKDRDKIRVIDAIDSVESTNKFTYSLTHRLLKKAQGRSGNSQVREILRFDVSQSYDFNKETRSTTPGVTVKPFSDLRFDLDSRLSDALMFNAAATYDIYEGQIQTSNFEFGIKPLDQVSLFVERRFIRDQSTFLLGSLYWAFQKGWQFRATTRYDELTETFRENDASILYNDPCKCWGFAFDYISRDLIAGSINKRESRFLFTLTLRGIGTEGVGDRFIDHIHRQF